MPYVMKFDKSAILVGKGVYDANKPTDERTTIVDNGFTTISTKEMSSPESITIWRYAENRRAFIFFISNNKDPILGIFYPTVEGSLMPPDELIYNQIVNKGPIVVRNFFPLSYYGTTRFITCVLDPTAVFSPVQAPNVKGVMQFYLYNSVGVIAPSYGYPSLQSYTYKYQAQDRIGLFPDEKSFLEGFSLPNEGGGISGGGGGTGNFDGTSDDIGFQDLPTLSAASAGFLTMYKPSVIELNDLASFMWTTDFWENIKKLFGNPMDVILGLTIVPVSPTIAGRETVKAGFIDTLVEMDKVLTQYVTVDCGELFIQEYWGSALDYSPYTKMQLYLPYIGTREISTDEVMNKVIHIKYSVDVLSGSLTAQIMCGSSVLYQFSGNCSSSIPVTSNDLTQVISAGLNIAAATGSFVASAGLSAPLSASMAVSGVMTTATNVMNAKPRMEHSGSMGGTGGLLGIQTPYLIMERPRQSLPEKYNTFVGYPSNMTMKLSDAMGYTEVDSIHLVDIPATSTELSEIETLLKGGVIF